MKLLSNMNEFLIRAFYNYPGGTEYFFFYKEVHSGGRYISRFSDQQVTSIKIAVASEEG